MNLLAKASFIFVAITFSSVALALPTNCEIKVKYYYKTGADETKTFLIPAKSQSDCQKKSSLYKENSTPQNVVKKEVSVKWLGN